MKRSAPIEPERRVVKKKDLPTNKASGMPKHYWDSVIRHLDLLSPDEALELDFGENAPPLARSSVHLAAARAGRKLSTYFSGTSMYLWMSGYRRERYRKLPPRNPIQCKVCGATVHRPTTGGSRQYVCAGTGGRLSWCQNVWKRSRVRGVSIEEYVEKYAKEKRKIRVAA